MNADNYSYKHTQFHHTRYLEFPHLHLLRSHVAELIEGLHRHSLAIVFVHTLEKDRKYVYDIHI